MSFPNNTSSSNQNNKSNLENTGTTKDTRIPPTGSYYCVNHNNENQPSPIGNLNVFVGSNSNNTTSKIKNRVCFEDSTKTSSKYNTSKVCSPSTFVKGVRFTTVDRVQSNGFDLNQLIKLKQLPFCLKEF